MSFPSTHVVMCRFIDHLSNSIQLYPRETRDDMNYARLSNMEMLDLQYDALFSIQHTVCNVPMNICFPQRDYSLFIIRLFAGGGRWLLVGCLNLTRGKDLAANAAANVWRANIWRIWREDKDPSSVVDTYGRPQAGLRLG
jgi:hypothetical protein